MSRAARQGMPAARWAALVTAAALVGWILGNAGLPSSYLFGALLLGLAVALWWPERMKVSRHAFAWAQAGAGVGIGTFLEPAGLADLGDDWLPVIGVTVGLIGAGILIGATLARATRIDAPTGTLGMVAGGASGIVSMADELGGDERIVAFMQYLRVLAVVTLTPLLVAVVIAAPASGAAPGIGGPFLGTPAGWLVTLGIGSVGALAGHALRVPAPALLGPLVLAAALAATPLDPTVPPAVLAAAFCLVGLRVGLGFTMQAIQQVRRLLVPVLVSLAALLAAGFGFAVLLDLTTSATLLDSYLATTPGGLFAVTAAAFDSGADATFVVSLQGLRLLAMVLFAPAAVRLALALDRRVGGSRAAGGQAGMA